MKPETRFRNNHVLPFLRTLKNAHWFTVQQASISGTPDILLCINAVFIAMELKSEEGDPSPLQLHNLKQVERAGGVPLIVRPQNWEIIKQILLQADNQIGEKHGLTVNH